MRKRIGLSMRKHNGQGQNARGGNAGAGRSKPASNDPKHAHRAPPKTAKDKKSGQADGHMGALGEALQAAMKKS